MGSRQDHVVGRCQDEVVLALRNRGVQAALLAAVAAEPRVPSLCLSPWRRSLNMTTAPTATPTLAVNPGTRGLPGRRGRHRRSKLDVGPE